MTPARTAFACAGKGVLRGLLLIGGLRCAYGEGLAFGGMSGHLCSSCLAMTEGRPFPRPPLSGSFLLLFLATPARRLPFAIIFPHGL